MVFSRVQNLHRVRRYPLSYQFKITVTVSSKLIAIILSLQNARNHRCCYVCRRRNHPLSGGYEAGCQERDNSDETGKAR
jgi:hypothetical protein